MSDTTPNTERPTDASSEPAAVRYDPAVAEDASAAGAPAQPGQIDHRPRRHLAGPRRGGGRTDDPPQRHRRDAAKGSVPSR